MLQHGLPLHPRGLAAAALVLALAAGLPPAPARAQSEGIASATTASAAYRFMGNKLMSLDLAVGDVRVEEIRFDWPATVMRMKTAYKATVKVANGSSRQMRIGLAIALYDAEKRLIGAGTTGTTLGTIDPGNFANFTIEFSHVKRRLEEAITFAIALETS